MVRRAGLTCASVGSQCRRTLGRFIPFPKSSISAQRSGGTPRRIAVFVPPLAAIGVTVALLMPLGTWEAGAHCSLSGRCRSRREERPCGSHSPRRVGGESTADGQPDRALDDRHRRCGHADRSCARSPAPAWRHAASSTSAARGQFPELAGRRLTCSRRSYFRSTSGATDTGAGASTVSPWRARSSSSRWESASSS